MGIHDAGVRETEREIVYGAIMVLESAKDNPVARVQTLGAKAPEEFLAILDRLETTDVDEMNADVLGEIEEIVLPKEAEIIGVYQSPQMALTPDVFMPLHLARELSGLGNLVQAVSVRLD